MTKCRRWNSATTRWRSTCGQPQTADRLAPGGTQMCFEGFTKFPVLVSARCTLTPHEVSVGLYLDLLPHGM
jgi:hypothetical protein